MWFINRFKKNNADILKKMEMACHNLNTPLATLEIIATLIQGKIKPEEHALLIAAIKQIREVSGQLAN